MSSDGVHRYLVTTTNDRKWQMYARTLFANWLEGRNNGDRETWLVTVFSDHSGWFLDAASEVGVTVEEIEGGGESESYVLKVGEPGSGWKERSESQP